MSPFQLFLYGIATMFVLFFSAVGLLALFSAILSLKRGWAEVESQRKLVDATIKADMKWKKK